MRALHFCFSDQCCLVVSWCPGPQGGPDSECYKHLTPWMTPHVNYAVNITKILVLKAHHLSAGRRATCQDVGKGRWTGCQDRFGRLPVLRSPEFCLPAGCVVVEFCRGSCLAVVVRYRGPGRAGVTSSKAAVKVPVTSVSGGPGGSLCAGPSLCPAPPGPVPERASEPPAVAGRDRSGGLAGEETCGERVLWDRYSSSQEKVGSGNPAFKKTWKNFAAKLALQNGQGGGEKVNLKADVTEGPSERTGSIVAPGGEPGRGLEVPGGPGTLQAS
ncbi:uncharacterized protein ACBT57_017088 [Dama dama]|uniref:uncharacterized protein LOC133063859 n=1 Tax=Dama dama TaxID=30532 RepID=UPI002A35ECFF|nr:uncharacterized protein LOC133063859 [Dama dama]